VVVLTKLPSDCTDAVNIYISRMCLPLLSKQYWMKKDRMFKRKNRKYYKGRSIEQLRHHYEVEKRIAERLRRSKRENRTEIMRTMYDELFAEVPDHPRLTAKINPERERISIVRQMRLLRHHLRSGQNYLEFGPGNCSLAVSLCSLVKHVYAVDICEQAGSIEKPENFTFIVYNGYNLDLPDNSIDIVFSNQVLEHLHPDDTEEHFRLVFRLLKPGGKYIFCTPQRLCGPGDISKYFSDVAEGFHLKEWTFGELSSLVKRVGFTKWQGRWYARGICIWLPRSLILTLERFLSYWPIKLRRRIGRYLLPSVTMIAQK